MNDAATTWISPYCSAAEIDTPRIVVWVLNPGGPATGSAEVTLRIYGALGLLQGTEKQSIEPMRLGRFGSVQAEDAWCHIQSDKPVFPWGLTAWRDGNEQGVVDMTFYRYEATQIPILRELAELIRSGFRPGHVKHPPH